MLPCTGGRKNTITLSHWGVRHLQSPYRSAKPTSTPCARLHTRVSTLGLVSSLKFPISNPLCNATVPTPHRAASRVTPPWTCSEVPRQAHPVLPWGWILVGTSEPPVGGHGHSSEAPGTVASRVRAPGTCPGSHRANVTPAHPALPRAWCPQRPVPTWKNVCTLGPGAPSAPCGKRDWLL